MKTKRILYIPKEVDNELIKLKGYDGYTSYNDVYIAAAKAFVEANKDKIREIESKND